MQQLLIDTDPGTDDAIALLTALNAPEIEVLGVTTVGGNATLSHTTRNALAILEHMGRTNVPVAKGANAPLAGGEFRHGYDFHGHRGIGIHLPRASIVPVQQDAPAFLAHALLNSSDGVTLVALGPLTNVAHLLQHYPEAGKRIARLVVMGGALEKGNITPYAEFNMHNDAEAAAILFSTGIPLTLVPLEACAQVMLSAKDLARWRDSTAPAARLAYRILHKWFQRSEDKGVYDPCDPLAMALALSPEIATYETGSISVDTTTGETYGRTLFQPGPGNVSLARQVHTAAFHRLLDSLLLKS